MRVRRIPPLDGILPRAARLNAKPSDRAEEILFWVGCGFIRAAALRRAKGRRRRELSGGILCIVLAVSMITLGVSPRQGNDVAASLAKAEAAWRAHRPRSYQFTIALGCFCPPSKPPTFRVTDGQPAPVGDIDAETQRSTRTTTPSRNSSPRSGPWPQQARTR